MESQDLLGLLFLTLLAFFIIIITLAKKNKIVVFQDKKDFINTLICGVPFYIGVVWYNNSSTTASLIIFIAGMLLTIILIYKVFSISIRRNGAGAGLLIAIFKMLICAFMLIGAASLLSKKDEQSGSDKNNLLLKTIILGFLGAWLWKALVNGDRVPDRYDSRNSEIEEKTFTDTGIEDEVLFSHELDGNDEAPADKVFSVISEIIEEEEESFKSYGEFKVSADYGPGKFYLDKVDGSYESSLQNLIHYILFDDDIYLSFLNEDELDKCSEAIKQNPDGIWMPDEDDYEEYEEFEKVQRKLDSIYLECIKRTGLKLKELGFDLNEGFDMYLED